jgi:hypothetical protein
MKLIKTLYLPPIMHSVYQDHLGEIHASQAYIERTGMYKYHLTKRTYRKYGFSIVNLKLHSHNTQAYIKRLLTDNWTEITTHYIDPTGYLQKCPKNNTKNLKNVIKNNTDVLKRTEKRPNPNKSRKSLSKSRKPLSRKKL